MSQPVLAILSGSNGAGKTTLTAYAREELQSAAVLDPDAISKSARDVSLESPSDIASGKRVLALAEVVILDNSSEEGHAVVAVGSVGSAPLCGMSLSLRGRKAFALVCPSGRGW